jgi:hypothetical protein
MGIINCKVIMTISAKLIFVVILFIAIPISADDFSAITIDSLTKLNISQVTIVSRTIYGIRDPQSDEIIKGYKYAKFVLPPNSLKEMLRKPIYKDFKKQGFGYGCGAEWGYLIVNDKYLFGIPCGIRNFRNTLTLLNIVKDMAQEVVLQYPDDCSFYKNIEESIILDNAEDAKYLKLISILQFRKPNH